MTSKDSDTPVADNLGFTLTEDDPEALNAQDRQTISDLMKIHDGINPVTGEAMKPMTSNEAASYLLELEKNNYITHNAAVQALSAYNADNYNRGDYFGKLQ